MSRPDHVARLYAVPPSEFTAARNRLVADLRKNAGGEDARALAKLRKPSAALWAVNRLARTEGKRVAALFEAVAQLRRNQLRDPRVAAEALRAQRAALETLIARGREVLSGAGLTASPPVLRRVSDTLMGAAVDRRHADALRRGELTEELSAPGFEAFSGTRLPSSVSPRLRLVRAPDARPPRVDREAIAAQRADAARRRRLEAENLERRAADQARDLEALEAERNRARARVAEVDERLRTARRAVRQATAAVKRARRNADAT